MKHPIRGIVLMLAMATACGVRAPPRPPHPDARPTTGEPNMVPIGDATVQAPASTGITHEPSFPDGGIPGTERGAADGGKRP